MLETIFRILSYNNSMSDVAINYTLATLMQICILHVGLHSKKAIFVSALCLWGFQIAVCLLTGCVGVSLVWSANAGIMFMHARYLIKTGGYEKESYRIHIAVIALASGIAAWIFYLIVSDHWITSFAHICAALLGLGIDFTIGKGLSKEVA
jgi:hypothetical protein